ncbi:MAG: VanZ family protein [Nitriliruptoraceae bacterium]
MLRRGTQVLTLAVAVAPIVMLTLFDPPDWLPFLPDPVVDTVDFAVLEMAANVALFVPLGLVLGFWWPHHRRVVWSAVALSVTIELLQLRLEDRVSDPVDVVANSLGAWLGYFTSSRLRRTIERMAGRRR